MFVHKQMSAYNLYHTLCVTIPQKPLSQKSLKTLAKKIEQIASTDQKRLEAIFLIIIEHARVNDEYVVCAGDEKISLPYGMRNSDDGGVSCDLEKLSPSLQHIVKKFCDVE